MTPLQRRCLISHVVHRVFATFPGDAQVDSLTMSQPRFVRRGRAADPEEPEYDLASDVESEELGEWLDRSSLTDPLGRGGRVRKFLAPGTVMDIYNHYQATRVHLGAPSVSRLGCKC